MSSIVLPPGTFPAPTGDNARPVFPSSPIPADLRPADTGDGADNTDVVAALRALAGVQPWPTDDSRPETTGFNQPNQSAAAATGDQVRTPVAPQPEPETGPEPAPLTETVDGRTRYLHVTSIDGGAAATTADGHLLARTDADGEVIVDDDGDDQLIWVDVDGYEIADTDNVGRENRNTGPLSRLFHLAGSRGHSDTDDSPTVDYYDVNGVKIEGFDVVPPGAPLGGRTRERGRRLVYAAAGVMAFTTVCAAVFGLVIGSSRVPAEGAISAQEAQAYGLSTFPVDSASSFGARYIEACMTHSDDRTQVAERADTLEAMSSGTVSTECGWTSGGDIQTVSFVAFNGFVDPVPGYEHGQAAYLGYDVIVDGQDMAMSVPVWVGPTEGGGDAMQVVGDIGLSPTAPMGQAPMPVRSPNVDQELGGQLVNTVVEPFLSAWAASDDRQMTLLTSREASTNVRTGLDGAVTRPSVGTVVARPDKPVPTSGEPAIYTNGDTAVLDVAVTWTLAESGATQEAGYRLYVVLEADRWLVTDVQNGLVDASGARSAGPSGNTSGQTGSTGNRGQSTTETSPTTSGSAGGTDSGGLGSVDDLQSGDDSPSG